ncbi:MAG: PAS domain-containing protein [Deltaproteobacteria bacterium]|nr:PAS domain-containing protein [Deltaproteobacteria bacterium]
MTSPENLEDTFDPRSPEVGDAVRESSGPPSARSPSSPTGDLLVPRARAHTLSGLPRLIAGEPLERDAIARKLLIVAGVRVAIVSVVLVALFVLSQLRLRELDRVPSWQYVLVGVAYALSLAYIALVRAPTLVVPLAYAQIGLDALIVSVLVIMTGGIESVFTFAYIFPVLGAASTLYRRGTVVAAVVSCFALGTILSLHLTGEVTLLPPVPFGSTVFSFVLYCAGMGLVALLSSALAEKARITGRRLAESQSDLEQLEQLHAAILRSLPAGLITIDIEGTIQFANEAAQQILAIPKEHLIRQPLFLVVPPMGRHWRDRRVRLMAEGMRERQEESFVRPDGRAIRLGFSFAPLGNETERWLGSIVVFQDLTDIVRLKEAVERAERLATLGKLAAGLAHEIRNPLASMCASVDVLRHTLDPPEAMKRLMSNVIREGERLNNLISDFLTFARPRELNLAVVDLGRVVADVVELFRHEARSDLWSLEFDVEGSTEVSIDAALIKQVVWNLLRNAGDAMKARPGCIRVRLGLEENRPTLRVSDEGQGIEPELQRRVFDPFFTTKEGGSGLGLAISHSILNAHGAQITVDSRVGRGTEFTIRFSAPAQSALPRPDARSGGEVEAGAEVESGAEAGAGAEVKIESGAGAEVEAEAGPLPPREGDGGRREG